MFGFSFWVASGGGGRYFPAGYTYRRRWVIPAAIHRLAAADGAVVVPFIETLASFKTVANGGHVQSATGDDIRFELDGNATKLAHELAAYSPTTGRVEAWVRIPNFNTATDLPLIVAYGNASVSGPEANAAACWAGFQWSVDMSTGQDSGPNEIDLDFSNVVAATIGGMDAGDFSSG